MTTDATLLAFVPRPDGTLEVYTRDGRTYVCRTPSELWADVKAVVADGGGGPRALPGAAGRTHYVRAEVVEEPSAYDIRREDIENGIQEAGDVFEEVCAQEFGALGRMGAQFLRKNGRKIGDAISPRTRTRGRLKR